MLQRAKGDISQLSSFELLRKDLKTADGAALSVVFSSVPMLVKVSAARGGEGGGYAAPGGPPDAWVLFCWYCLCNPERKYGQEYSVRRCLCNCLGF